MNFAEPLPISELIFKHLLEFLWNINHFRQLFTTGCLSNDSYQWQTRDCPARLVPQLAVALLCFCLAWLHPTRFRSVATIDTASLLYYNSKCWLVSKIHFFHSKFINKTIKTPLVTYWDGWSKNITIFTQFNFESWARYRWPLCPKKIKTFPKRCGPKWPDQMVKYIFQIHKKYFGQFS